VTGGGEQLVLIAVPGPAVHPVPWAGLAVGAVLFAAVALLARRRAGQMQTAPPWRLGRIVEAALVWAFVYQAMRMPGFGQLDYEGVGPVFLFGQLLLALGFAILAALLIGTADLLLDGLRPRRTRLWLLGGPPVVALFGIGFLAATGWMDMVSRTPGWREFMLAAGALAAGLAWWSRLPATDRRIAGIFD
jgi:hypothetical protein